MNNISMTSISTHMVFGAWVIQPFISMGLWWLLACLSLVIVVGYLAASRWEVNWTSRVGMIVLLCVSLACPLVLLLNPISVEGIPRAEGKPRAVVLVDASASMNTAVDQQTRWSQAVNVAKKLSEEHPHIEVLLQSFSDSEHNDKSSPIDSSHSGPIGKRTDLRQTLQATMRQAPPKGQAIVILSDGAHNTGSERSLIESAEAARSLDIPIYTVTFGNQVDVKNVVLNARSPRLVIFPDRKAIARLTISQRGYKQDRIDLIVREGKEVLHKETLRLPAQGELEVRFPIPSRDRKKDAGPDSTNAVATSDASNVRVIQFEVSALPGEATDADNKTMVQLQSIDRPIETLVLEGKPYWDSKFLVRNFSSDPVLNVTAINRINDTRFIEQTTISKMVSEGSSVWKTIDEKGLPLEDLELLKKFRVLVLGRESAVFLSAKAIENIRQWLSLEGGCLVCARGAPTNVIAQRLAEILPVRWTKGKQSRFRTQLSDYGSEQFMLDGIVEGTNEDPLRGMPSLETSTESSIRPGLPQVLIESSDRAQDQNIQPVVTYQPYGMGQSIVVEGSGMWRWAFLPPQYADRDAVYPALWQGLVQWIVARQDLLPGQQIAIRPDRSVFLGGDGVSGTMLMRDTKAEPPMLELVRDSNRIQVLKPTASSSDPGVFRFDFGNLESGYYEIKTQTSNQVDTLQNGAALVNKGNATAACEVRDFWLETLDVDARPDLMQQIASRSGGKVVAPEAAREILDDFHKHLIASRPEQFRKSPLWDRPWVLLTIFGIWCSSWIVRRLSGLI
jgi:hypothetical protein